MIDGVLKEFYFQYPFWCPLQSSVSLKPCVTTQSEWYKTSLRDLGNTELGSGVEAPGYYQEVPAGLR
jgi:hypothetical protein